MYKFSYLDLWPYICIALIFLLCYTYKIKNSSKIIYITLLIFCILRYDIGWDYESYIIEIQQGYDYLINGRYEPLSKFIFIASSALNFYPLTFILFGWITLLLVYKTINTYSNNSTLSWLVYYSLPLFFFASLSTIRQSLATAVILYSYKLIAEGKYLKFFSSIIIASLFHLSGIVGFFLLIIHKLKFNRFINIIVFIISFIISFYTKEVITNILSVFFPESLISIRFQRYVETDTESPSILQYLYYFFITFNLIFYNKIINIRNSNKDFISFSTFGIFLFNILSFEPITATRLSAFFLIFLIFLIPDYTKIFSFKIQKVIGLIIFVLLIIISFFYLYIYIQAYVNGELIKISFIPYKTWLNNL